MDQESQVDYYEISETTADGITFRNRRGWPINITHEQWEKWHRAPALKVTLEPLSPRWGD